MASAQIVLPVPGGPAKLKPSASPVGCRSPRPQRLKMRSCCVTCARAVSSARRVAGGRITSSNVRRGTIDSTARRPLMPNRRVNGIGATPPAYRLARTVSKLTLKRVQHVFGWNERGGDQGNRIKLRLRIKAHEAGRLDRGGASIARRAGRRQVELIPSRSSLHSAWTTDRNPCGEVGDLFDCAPFDRAGLRVSRRVAGTQKYDGGPSQDGPPFPP